MDFRSHVRPRLLPGAVLLRRGRDELQIGLDPGWRVSDDAGVWHEVLSGLDGRRSWRQIAADHRSVDLGELSRLLDTLAAHELVAFVHDPGSQPPVGRRVRLIGGGSTAATIGSRLVRAGIDVRADEKVDEMVHEMVDSGGDVMIERGPEPPGVDLTVLVANSFEVNRGLAARLLRHDAPHLVVRPAPAGGAVVGPLIVPGRTACLHCTDLTRRDADQAWPRLLEQLQHRPAAPASTVVADWTTAVAVTQILGFLVSERPETYGASLEISTPRYATVWRPWSPHPECGCRWFAAG